MSPSLPSLPVSDMGNHYHHSFSATLRLAEAGPSCTAAAMALQDNHRNTRSHDVVTRHSARSHPGAYVRDLHAAPVVRF